MIDGGLPATENTIVLLPEQARPISPRLFGAFFEDLNYAADGGLYAELIQNRSFEYSSRDNLDWNFLTAWEVVQRGGDCAVTLADTAPLHANNPHYLVLHVAAPEGAVGLRNHGYGGINLHAGEAYEFFCFVRRLDGAIGPLRVQLLGRKGALLAEADLPAPTAAWQRVVVILRPCADDPFSSCCLLFNGVGTVALDVVSLFPCKTFHNRPNGLRSDLAQAIADLKPRFLRFPGGCLAHGDGLDNMYRWKETVGPLHTRREQPNIWNYHQSVGLGYYEYFQFCEDIGATPLPVVPAGVCCPNSEARFTGAWEQGQCGLPLEEMTDYVQEVLDLIEWANGPADSPWGALRAAAGHPEPFGLQYVGVGNEDQITSMFCERFRMIFGAMKAKHPEITVIGTVGPYTEGCDYNAGWQFARELGLSMVDEHGYQAPEWFWENLGRFDAYDRTEAQVYLGEYAAHDVGRRNTLRSALAEAAYLTALERNGDVVRLSSYAPLLGKQKNMQWTPNLIYFDNQSITLSINCYVQQLFSRHAGDVYLPADVRLGKEAKNVAASCVQDTASGDIILKVVSRSPQAIPALINLSAVGSLSPTATCTTLCGDPLAENEFGRPPCIAPESKKIAAGPHFHYVIPAHSFSVIRLESGHTDM